MVHTSNKGPEVTKCSLYLASMSELKPFVNIYRMFHWPVILSPLVYGCTVSPQLSSWLDFLKEKAVSLQPSGMALVDEVIGQLA